MPDGALSNGIEKHLWADIVQSRLNGRFEQLVSSTFETVASAELRFNLVKHGHTALSLSAIHDGRHAHVKLFYKDGLKETACYIRERNALLAFRRTGLVPKILNYLDDRRLITTEHLPGLPLTDPAHGLSPKQVGETLGAFLATMHAKAPHKAVSGNWLGYLRKFGSPISQKVIDGAAGLLAGIPLCGLSLSRGDPALHNYILREDESLVAVDFEEARFRPHGWDFILAYHMLLERFGKDNDAAIEGFHDAFDAHHSGALLTGELRDLARILFCARALASDKARS